jgi:hypothetical protein
MSDNWEGAWKETVLANIKVHPIGHVEEMKKHEY